MSKSKASGISKWEKWFLLGGVHVALSGFVYYFNERVFGPEEAKFYLSPLIVLAVVSIIAGRHIHRGDATEVFRRKAFHVELLILSVLLLNVVVSMMVLREMSLATQAEGRFDRNLQTASSLDYLAQRELVSSLVKEQPTSKIKVFQQKEQILVGLLFLELLVGMGGGLLLVAYSLGDSDGNGEIDIFEEEDEEEKEVQPKKKRKSAFVYEE